MTPYPPSAPFMALAFPDREAVFNVALRLYHAALTPGYRRPGGFRAAKLARLQRYVCGDPEQGLEDWMLVEGEPGA